MSLLMFIIHRNAPLQIPQNLPHFQAFWTENCPNEGPPSLKPLPFPPKVEVNKLQELRDAPWGSPRNLVTLQKPSSPPKIPRTIENLSSPYNNLGEEGGGGREGGEKKKRGKSCGPHPTRPLGPNGDSSPSPSQKWSMNPQIIKISFPSGFQYLSGNPYNKINIYNSFKIWNAALSKIPTPRPHPAHLPPRLQPKDCPQECPCDYRAQTAEVPLAWGNALEGGSYALIRAPNPLQAPCPRLWDLHPLRASLDTNSSWSLAKYVFQIVDGQHYPKEFIWRTPKEFVFPPMILEFFPEEKWAWAREECQRESRMIRALNEEMARQRAEHQRRRNELLNPTDESDLEWPWFPHNPNSLLILNSLIIFWFFKLVFNLKMALRLAGKVYREFSRQKYAKYRAQYPKLREGEVVTKIIKEWDALDINEKRYLLKVYLEKKFISEEESDSEENLRKIH